MANLSAFLPDVFSDVDGVPRDYALHAIRRACIRFCQETGVIKREFEITTVNGTAKYSITPNIGEVVHKVISARTVNGLPIVGKLEEDIASSMGFDWRNAKSNTPRFFYTTKTGEIRLVSTPDSVFSVFVSYSAKPSETTETVDDELYGEYVNTIVEGAKSRLFGMLARPWANPQMQEFSERKYRDGEAKCKEQLALARSSSTPMMRFPMVGKVG